MAIEKKTLIGTLKTTKKANVATNKATNDGSSTRKARVGKLLNIGKKQLPPG